MKIAVLGMGIMGSAIAPNLLRAGLSVTVWNRTREKAESLARDGATVASTPAAAAASSDLVLTMLADWDAVESGDDRPGRCPRWDERARDLVADEHHRRRGDRTRGRARRGGGGDPRRRACVRDEGAGRTGRAARDRLARALGFEPELFLETIAGGSVDSPYAQIKSKAMAQEEFPPSFPLRLARKDASLVVQEAERRELDLPAIRAALRQLERAQELGLGDQDLAAVYESARPGVERPA